MKRNEQNRLIYCLLAVMCFVSLPATGWGQNKIISTYSDLADFRNEVNGTGSYSGNANNYSGKTVELAADIDLSTTAEATGWTPIGASTTDMFKGTFDGKGHVIKGLVVSSADYGGLFGYMASATVKNLGVVIGDTGVKGQYAAAGIAGFVATGCIIKNCFVAGGPITGAGNNRISGGIVGYANMSTGTLSISDCYSACDIGDDGGTSGYSGGIVAYPISTGYTISNCYALGTIKGKGYAGGISGAGGGSDRSKIGTITNCIALSAEITSTGNANRIYATNQSSTANYASPKMVLNSGTSATKDGTDLNAANFANNSGVFNTWSSTNWDLSDATRLPVLKQTDGSSFSATYTQAVASKKRADYVNDTPKPPVPPVPPYFNWYNISIPAAEGIIIVRNDREFDSYKIDVIEASSLSFSLQAKEGYDLTNVVVTTSRGEILTPREEDGRYLIHEVNEDVEVTIKGAVPLANEEISHEGTAIYAADGKIFVEVPESVTAYVYTSAGALKYSGVLSAGSNRIAISGSGIYFVRLSNGAVKKVAL